MVSINHFNLIYSPCLFKATTLSIRHQIYTGTVGRVNRQIKIRLLDSITLSKTHFK